MSQIDLGLTFLELPFGLIVIGRIKCVKFQNCAKFGNFYPFCRIGKFYQFWIFSLILKNDKKFGRFINLKISTSSRSIPTSIIYLILKFAALYSALVNSKIALVSFRVTLVQFKVFLSVNIIDIFQKMNVLFHFWPKCKFNDFHKKLNLSIRLFFDFILCITIN